MLFDCDISWITSFTFSSVQVDYSMGTACKYISHAFPILWFTYRASDIARKDVFSAWRFILNEMICSEWPYLIRGHLSFLYLCFVIKYLL